MKVAGGTTAKGVPRDAFAMPPGMAMRYDRPSAALQGCVTGYTVYHSDDLTERVDWFLPSPVMLCLFVQAGTVTARIGNHAFGPMAEATVIGPTSRAMCVTTRGGTMVGIGLTAIGWARMTDSAASLSHNRILSADRLLNPVAVEALVRHVAALPDDGAVKSTLDALLPALLRPVTGTKVKHMPLIARLSELATTDGVIDVAEISADMDVPEARLRRLAQRYFGMPPKLLLRRARFLRSFVQLLQGGDIADSRRIDTSYFDMSHYLRDANTFLGTTPRRFMAHASPFLQASIRARMAVLGSPTPALQPAAADRTDAH